jgi:hypothetical protein
MKSLPKIDYDEQLVNKLEIQLLRSRISVLAHFIKLLRDDALTVENKHTILNALCDFFEIPKEVGDRKYPTCEEKE